MVVSPGEKVSVDGLLEVGNRVDFSYMWEEGIPKEVYGGFSGKRKDVAAV